MKAPRTMLTHVFAIAAACLFLPLSSCGSDGPPGDIGLDAATDSGAPDNGTDLNHDSVFDTSNEVTDDLSDTGQSDMLPDDADNPDAHDADAGEPVDSDRDGIPDDDERKIGTDPLVADTDTDGIDDGDELASGTDPTDPADADAWHPELKHHPRLFFLAEDIQTIAAKMSSADGPDKILASRIRSVAGQTLPEHPSGTFGMHVDRTRGQIAENAAFLALVTGDSDMLAKAVTAITTGYVDPNTADLAMDSDYDLYGSEALTGYCQAWDWLAGNPAIDPADLDAVRQSIIARIDDFRLLIHEGPLLPMMLFARNNHVIKVWSALGLCALAINDRPEAASDISEAMTGIDWVFVRTQLTPDGGHAEGCHYLTYGSDTYLPFLYAWHRLAGDETFRFKVVPALQGDNPLAGQIVELGDFAAVPAVRAAYRLSLETVTPDGICPPSDDSNGAAQHGAILATMFDDDTFLWQWHMKAAGLDSAPLHALSLIAHSGAEPPPIPDAQTDFMRYSAGMAVLRTSWDPDALYVYLSGEHGPVRENGIGHEHPDELSFMLWAFERPLIIDPGYINYENHSLVFRPTDHNTILVDGNGSHFDSLSEMGLNVGNDAFLSCIGHGCEEGVDDCEAAWTAVSTTYENVAFQRQVVRIRTDYVVIADLIDSGSAHDYTLLLNGMAGGTTPDSSFLMTDSGATWVNAGPAIRAVVIPSSGTARYSSDLQEHNAPSWGAWHTHERLAVESSMPAGRALFLTVLLPAPSPDDLPEVLSAGQAGSNAFVRLAFPGLDPELIVLAAQEGQIEGLNGGLIEIEGGLNIFAEDAGDTISRRMLHLKDLETAAGDPGCGETGGTL